MFFARHISLLSLLCIANTSPIEDKIETEIDEREPRSFLTPQMDMLFSRMEGFEKMHYKNPKTGDPFSIGNWEIFAARYWYETRIHDLECPQLPRGIAAHCDLALMVPCLFGNATKPPKTIFVHTFMLPHFVESTLRFSPMDWRFVLVTGGVDATIPRSNMDLRWINKQMRGFINDANGGPYWQELLQSERVLHWFAENHDLNHEKVSTLPTGMGGFFNAEELNDIPTNGSIAPLHNRPLLIMVSDRVREGTGQWTDRRNVYNWCAGRSYCIQPFGGAHSYHGVPHKDFVDHVASVPLIACVHGGGIDPSPKAWESILIGTIPVIQHSTLDDAYSQLPVAFVDKWEDLFENPKAEEMMRGWIHELSPFYVEGSPARREVLRKLTSAYWIEQFNIKYEEGMLKLEKTV